MRVVREEIDALVAQLRKDERSGGLRSSSTRNRVVELMEVLAEEPPLQEAAWHLVSALPNDKPLLRILAERSSPTPTFARRAIAEAARGTDASGSANALWAMARDWRQRDPELVVDLAGALTRARRLPLRPLCQIGAEICAAAVLSGHVEVARAVAGSWPWLDLGTLARVRVTRRPQSRRGRPRRPRSARPDRSSGSRARRRRREASPP